MRNDTSGRASTTGPFQQLREFWTLTGAFSGDAHPSTDGPSPAHPSTGGPSPAHPPRTGPSPAHPLAGLGPHVRAEDIFRCLPTTGDDADSAPNSEGPTTFPLDPTAVIHPLDAQWFTDRGHLPEVDQHGRLTLGGRAFPGPLAGDIPAPSRTRPQPPDAPTPLTLIDRITPQFFDRPPVPLHQTRILWLGINATVQGTASRNSASNGSRVRPLTRAQPISEWLRRAIIIHRSFGSVIAQVNECANRLRNELHTPQYHSIYDEFPREIIGLAEAIDLCDQQYRMLIQDHSDPHVVPSWELRHRYVETWHRDCLFDANTFRLTNRPSTPNGPGLTADHVLRMELYPWRTKSAAGLPRVAVDAVRKARVPQDLPPSVRVTAESVLEVLVATAGNPPLVIVRKMEEWLAALTAVAPPELKDEVRLMLLDQALVPASSRNYTLSCNNLVDYATLRSARSRAVDRIDALNY
ncbi:hypothetical protein [Corynebacterium heidelbergense]|uniref:Uncharacterized protein n=1 Tax=Corynebacterium heidelbergense TaxID=2055947 RepID=A0A364V9A6_9CORY|nr:hypothetical protein [Corynebacterium heidelbergense]RAV33198.1 hypothetical protein CWC39_09775 [Corynebacterium heidelbergense]WCZ35743.1 hypothetical protein CHEID_00820 [Corynebacterium heidelbergense]